MKTINQSTGRDSDPTHIELSESARKKKKHDEWNKPPIELDAILNVVCTRCETKGAPL